MVERVEALRERERVLGEHGEFEGADRRLDHVVEAGGLEHQRPQLVGVLVRRPARAAASAAMAGGQRRLVHAVALAQLCKMLRARTAAYCRYGPLSPSKLSASSMSKAMTLVREYFTMK